MGRVYEIIPEEPGYIAVALLVLAFLALTPKAGCSFQEDAARPAPSAPAH